MTVATFTHASGVEPSGAFVATINWGDGTTSTGTITQSGSTYTVKWSHTYPRKATWTISTSVVEAGNKPGPLAAQGGSGGQAYSEQSAPASSGLPWSTLVTALNQATGMLEVSQSAVASGTETSSNAPASDAGSYLNLGEQGATLSAAAGTQTDFSSDGGLTDSALAEALDRGALDSLFAWAASA
jgi:hypothetical protein